MGYATPNCIGQSRFKLKYGDIRHLHEPNVGIRRCNGENKKDPMTETSGNGD